MRNHLYVAMYLIAVTLVFSGCSAIQPKPDAIQVSLVDIKIQQIKLFESAFEIKLRVFNLSDTPFDVKALDCRLSLGGKAFALGVTDRKTQIPAYGTAVLPVVVFSSVVNMIQSLITLGEKEKLEYQISGQVHLSGGLPLPSRISFSSTGQLSLAEIQ
jgi:LEA14-like dessication related protein